MKVSFRNMFTPAMVVLICCVLSKCAHYTFLSAEQCLVALGMETKGIRDGQISASSEFSASYTASFGRLQFSGTWITQFNDINQWLQIDLMTNLYVSVTRVATQGRYDWDEWVTEYKLQYSSDKVDFQYYRDRGQSRDKVLGPY